MSLIFARAVDQFRSTGSTVSLATLDISDALGLLPLGLNSFPSRLIHLPSALVLQFSTKDVLLTGDDPKRSSA